MRFSFPMAYGINFFAMTGLMIYISLIGKSSLAADIAIVQASTLALFHTFSGNARSLILNKKSIISVDNLLAIRYLLVVPLSLVSLFLSIYIANVGWIFAALLILRRGSEWLNDLYLSENEVEQNYLCAKIYTVIQGVTLFVVFLSIHISNFYFYISLLLWATIPLISNVRYFFRKSHFKLFNDINITRLLPHLGSTAAIGIGVYVFRLVILSLVNKPTAGDLFSAFAIGGLIASVFVQTIGPSIVNNESLQKESFFPKLLHLINFILIFIGLVLISVLWDQNDEIIFIGKNGLFFGAIGFSLLGGALMVYGQHTRLQILQQFKNSDVYGPDVLINIIFIASVPFLYYIFGSQILPSLFLISAAINYIFYRFYHIRINKNPESFILKIPNAYLIFIISGLIFIPLFFQLNSGIFNDKSLVFDTKGLLYNLPIPLSVIACLFGFVAFNDYKKSNITTTVVLMLFMLMIVSTVVTTNGDLDHQQSKMIFMMQFIIPILGLILGQLIYKDMKDLKIIAKSFLYIIVVLVPLQLAITWLQGESILVSYLYLFSFYQHLQYGSVIVVSAYLFSLFILKENAKYRNLLFILLPLVGLYSVASASRLSVLLYTFGIAIFCYYHYKTYIKKIALSLSAVSVICMSGYLVYQINNSLLYQEKQFINYDNSASPEVHKRRFYWKYYVDGIFDGVDMTLLGHSERPNRTTYPSAHNYYLDIAYNFGLISLLPIFLLIIYTINLIYKYRYHIMSSPGILGITFITLFMIIIDNSLKVGFRQPYPGIYSFFIWGLLIGILNNVKNHTQYLVSSHKR